MTNYLVRDPPALPRSSDRSEGRRGPSIPWVVGAGVLLGLVFLGGATTMGVGLPLVMGGAGLILAGVLIRQPSKLLLGIILLELPFTYDVHFFYKEEMGLLGAVGGLNLSVMTVALLMLYGIWLLRVMVRVDSNGSLAASPPTSRAAIAYVLVVAVTLVFARDRELAAFELAMLLQVLLLYVYVTRWVTTRRDILFVVAFLLAGLALEGLLMVSLSLMGESLSFTGLSATIEESGRVSGTIGSPTMAAGYLSLFMGPALGVLLSRARRSLKILAGGAAILGTLGLIVTLSRGGWLALAVCGAVVSVAAIRRGWMSPFTVIGGVLATLFFAVLFQEGILARLWTSDSVAAAYSRVPLMELAFRMIGANPIFGVGPNNFAAAIETYASGDLSREWLYTVHNRYLLVWAESGPVALIAFVAFLGASVRAGWRAYEMDDPVLSPLALGVMAGLLGHMVHMMSEAFTGKILVEGLWLTAALLVVLERAARQSSEGHESEEQRALPG